MPKFEMPPQKSAEEIEKEEEAKYEENKKRGYTVNSERKISPEVEKETKDFLAEKRKEKEDKMSKSESKRKTNLKISQARKKQEKGELLSQEETALLRSQEILEKEPEEEFTFETEKTMHLPKEAAERITGEIVKDWREKQGAKNAPIGKEIEKDVLYDLGTPKPKRKSWWKRIFG